jgi:hypothetical protein
MFEILGNNSAICVVTFIVYLIKIPLTQAGLVLEMGGTNTEIQ